MSTETSEARMADRLARRVEKYGALYAETGEARYANIVANAERLLRRLAAR